jgi:hypothetical protein
LPVALLRIRNAPRAKIHLNPFEKSVGGQFPSNYLVTDLDSFMICNRFRDISTSNPKIGKQGYTGPNTRGIS